LRHRVGNACIGLAGAVALTAGVLAASHARAQDLGTDAQREAGKVVYEHKCAQCHGDTGHGDGIATHYFKPAPRDLTAATFKIRTTPSGELPSDADLMKVIEHGMPYTGMPAWPHLTKEELANVVYYIKSFVGRFADADAMVPPIKIPSAPRFSAESAEKGRTFYEENKCADCHGNAGRGDGKSAPTLKDDWDQPIRPADMTRRWTFRGGSTREDIYRTFTTGLNGTPMPSYADLIAEEDRWHLVDYVYSLSRDEAAYATVVIASGIETEIDLDPAAFETAPAVFFPVFGQVIDPGRNFTPSCNGIEVRAVYNATDIAFMLTWSDMRGDSTGSNGPTMAAGSDDPSEAEPALEVFSDAVALQTPAKPLAGVAKPYFLFGDARMPANIWHFDLAQDQGTLLVGRGKESIEPAGQTVPVRADYKDGAWNVIFKLSRHPEMGFAFNEAVFLPIAFSVWDGFYKERGSKRGVTSWYNVYLKPVETKSRAMPVLGYGLLTLLLEVAVIAAVRSKSGARTSLERH
jgi:DMSO reductase family type II enzyme heme b subunit